MINKETTFEELRELKVIKTACLNATIEKGWKNLGEMMAETGTVVGLWNALSPKSRLRLELINALDRLPTLDKALAAYLQIKWDLVESLEANFNILASTDEAGNEVRRCFHSAWELRTLAIHDQDVFEERLMAYPPLTQKKMLLWAIACFKALDDFYWKVTECCSNLSDLELASDYLTELLRRFCFVHEQKPFPEWDDFVRFEFQQLTYDFWKQWFRISAKDPSFVDQIVGAVYLPEKVFLEKMAQLMNKRYAEAFLYRLIPKLIDVMSEWERASRNEQIAYMASYIMEVSLNKQDEMVLCDLHGHLGYMPLFFLACELLDNHHENPDFVFAVTNGIIEDPEHRMANIRESKFYSEYVIRSWSNGKIRDFTLNKLNSWDWSVYTELNEAFFLLEDNPIWERIRKEERVTTTFKGFGALLRLTHGYVMENVNGRQLLVNSRKLPGFSVAAYAKELSMVLNGQYTETAQFSIRELAGECAAPLPLDQLVHLTTWLTGQEYPDGMIVLARNHVDVEQAFVRYLQEKGEPMHRQELIDRYREEYPDLKLSDHTLLDKLYSNPRFVVRKAAGVYALSEWKSRFYKSVGDLAEEILRKAGQPMSIEQLHKKVVKKFQNTSPQSMEGCLRLDARKRFVRLPQNRIGLAKEAE